jgi:AcrR family transcriptional regulator
MTEPEPGVSDSVDARSVQDRLVEAGEELFCQHGFNETSVRDIAAAAGCNIASINYYFGGKDKLYEEVWRRRLASIRDHRLATIEKVMSSDKPPALEALLRSYAEGFLEPLVEGDPVCRFGILMAREMVDPRLPPEIFLNEMVAPVMSRLTEALQAICPWLETAEARYVILSVVGQLIHAVAAKEMVDRSEQADLPALDLGEFVEHIVKFSSAGIRAYANGRGERV